MSSKDDHAAAERTANHSVRSWLRSLLRRPSDPYADRGIAGPSSTSAIVSPDASSNSGTDMISFHHTMEDAERPIFAPPPRSFSGGSSNGSLSYETAARRTIAQPIATPRIGASHASQTFSPKSSLATPSSASASPLKSPRLGRTLSIGVASLTGKLHHQRRASETYRSMRSGSNSEEHDSHTLSLARSISKTLDEATPLVSSPPPLSDKDEVTSISFAQGTCDNPSGLDAERSESLNSGQQSIPNAVADSTSDNVSATTNISSPTPMRSPTATKFSSTSSPQQGMDISNELLLPEGEQMLKVTHKKVKPRTFKLDPDRGQILWESKKNNRVNLESIREVRFGPSAASYRTSLNISSAHEPRWLTIIYQNGGIYKALHLIALSDASLSRWRTSLLHMQSLRRVLIGAVGSSSSIEHRRHLWMRHQWKDADQTNDEKLSIDEVMQLCRRLGIESNKAHLRRCFNLADWRNRGYLDFQDFQNFVSLLKQRSDVQSIFAAWADQAREQSARRPSASSASNVKQDATAQSIALEHRSSTVGSSEADPTTSLAPAIAETTLAIGPEPCRTRAISIESFRRFIREEQGNREFSDGQIDDLFRRHCNSRLSTSLGTGTTADKFQMDYDGFLDFLSSSDNPPLLDQLPLFSTMVSDPVDMPIICRPVCSDRTDPLQARDVPSNSLVEEKDGTKLQQQQRTPSRAFADTTDELIAAGASDSMANTRKVAAHLRKSTVQHDMTRPLSEYYISSSHNTYLVGGQWKGDSTVEGYIRALLQGARSVELDCWDGPNNIPQITHGRTLTTRVPFQDVISAIARYAFVTSPYPLILSLEVHADPPQQEVMARILRDTLGEMLLSQPLGSQHLPGADDELPSPEQLKYKVLVKAKNVSALEVSNNLKDQLQIAADSQSTQLKDGSTVVPTMVLEPPTSATDTTTTTDSEMESRLASAKQLVRRVTRRGHRSDSGTAGAPHDRKRDSADAMGAQRGAKGAAGRSNKQGKKMMSTALASLLIYTIGVKCRGFNKKESYATQHMVSLSEKTALKMIRDPVSNEALIKHNRTHLTRVYPSMMSFARLHASRNFVPLEMWATGCQLVALNWQTTDLGFELNQAMFSRNGRCGYVLKPAALRSKEHGKTLAGKAVRFRLDLRIVSAQQLPKKAKAGSGKDKEKSSSQDSREPIDPFVVVSLLTPGCWGKQPKGLLKKASKGQTTDLPVAPAQQRPDESDSASAFADVEEKPHGHSADFGSRLEDPSDSEQLATAPSAGSTKTQPGPEEGTASSTNTFAKVGSLSPSQLLRTPTIKGNGFSPEWNTDMSVLIDVPAGASNELLALIEAYNTSASSDTLAQPELERLSRGLMDLCFVRFEIFDDDLEGESATASASAATLDANTQTRSTSMTSYSGSTSRLSLDSGTAAGKEASLDITKSVAGTGRPRSGSETSSASSTASIDADSVAAYSVSIGALQQGYRHLPLYDHQLSQFLFSTLFVHSRLRLVGIVDVPAPSKHS